MNSSHLEASSPSIVIGQQGWVTRKSWRRALSDDLTTIIREAPPEWRLVIGYAVLRFVNNRRVILEYDPEYPWLKTAIAPIDIGMMSTAIVCDYQPPALAVGPNPGSVLDAFRRFLNNASVKGVAVIFESGERFDVWRKGDRIRFTVVPPNPVP